MQPETLRAPLTWLALFLLVTCACQGGLPARCPTPPNCALLACEGKPQCTANGQVENCANGQDDDADGLVDGDDPDCVSGVSPSNGTNCSGKNVTTTAGADTDFLVDADNCDDAIGSDSGDGDTIVVDLTETEGFLIADVEIAENGIGSSPTAHIVIDTETAYGGEGDLSYYLSVDGSPSPGAEVDTICHSRGYNIPVVLLSAVPTWPRGGIYDCTTTISIIGDGSPASNFRVTSGTGFDYYGDSDGDGVANGDDLFCPKSIGSVGACGCAQCVTYLDANGGCDVPPPAGQCFFDLPAPAICEDCGLKVDDVLITAQDGGPLRVETDGDVVCSGCQITKSQISEYQALVRHDAEIQRTAFGALLVDQRGGDYHLEIGSVALGGVRGARDQVVVVPDALLGADPFSASIAVETPGDDLVAAVEIESGGQTYHRETATTGGVSVGRIHVVFDAEATALVSQTGWRVAAIEGCPRLGDTAILSDGASCLARLERENTGDRILTPQIGLEVANKVASNIADLGLGELISVASLNGVGTYRADNFSLVPSLSEINGFNLRNVLGALHLNAPGFPNDGRFSYLIPSGSLTSQYFPEIPGFGASQFGFGAVRDATYVDGDPNVGRGVFATPTGVQRLAFRDFGAGYPFLTSSPVFSGAPSGYSITSAFQTSDSSNVLFAARSNTAGANGRIFLWNGSSNEAGDFVGVDPRLIRCASAVPGTWICVTANYESGNVSVITWDGDASAAVAGTLAVGPNPLVPGIAAANGEVRVVVPSFTGDTATALRLDGTTGAEIARKSYALSPGAAASSALILDDASTGVVTLNGLDALQIIRNTFNF